MWFDNSHPSVRTTIHEQLFWPITTDDWWLDYGYITSNNRPFGCPIIYTGIYSQWYFIHWNIRQCFIQSSSLANQDAIFVNNLLVMKHTRRFSNWMRTTRLWTDKRSTSIVKKFEHVWGFSVRWGMEQSCCSWEGGFLYGEEGWVLVWESLNRQTDTTENIIFPQFHWRLVKLFCQLIRHY